jgi:ADP-ribosylation factor-like protein 2
VAKTCTQYLQLSGSQYLRSNTKSENFVFIIVVIIIVIVVNHLFNAILISFKLNIWDVGGQKSLRAFWRNYFESTDGLIFVVDSSDKLRLNDCKTELKNLLTEERLMGATLLVFANKQDLMGSLKCEDIKNLLELESITTHHWKIVGCSAYSGHNLLDGIDWLLEDIASRIFTDY